MNFYEIKELLFEPRFFALVAKEHEDYLAFENLAQHQYNLTEGSFNISMTTWINSGRGDIGQLKFRINQKFTEAIHEYWQQLEEKHKGYLSDEELLRFQNEAIAIKNTMLKYDYLKFTKSIIELLDRVIKYSVDIRSPKNEKANMATSQQEQIEKQEPIIWNAGVSILGTLFQELTTLKVPNSSRTCISADYAKLLKFICDNFVDENGEPFPISSVKTYVYPKQKKAAEKNKLKIGF